jgi:fructokinase
VAKAAQARGALLSIDPNVRPFLIDDFASYKARLGQFLDLAHLIKVSDEDLKSLDADKSIEQHAAELLARPNCELVVVTLGEKGSLAFTQSGKAAAGIYAPPVFGDTVGAGDSLMAGILTTLGERGDLTPARLRSLGSAELEEILHFGAIVAGLNCAHKGCVPPTRAEVDAVLNGAGD